MKVLKWLFAVIGIILIMIFLSMLTANIIWGHQLRKTMARLQAEGRPVTIAELRSAPIPQDQNAAPLIGKAAFLLTNKPVPKAIQELSTLNQELSKLGSQNLSRNLQDLPENKRERLKSLIEEPDNKKLFDIVSEAAHKPKCDSEFKYERSPSFYAIRQLIEFQILKAEALAQEGALRESGQTLLDGFRLAHLLRQAPMMTQLLVSIAADGILIHNLYRITNAVDFPADLLQAFETELKGHLDNEAYVRALDEQRVITALAGYQDYFNSMNEIWKLPAPLIWLWGKSGLQHRDMNVFLTLHAKIQDECRMPSEAVLAIKRQNPIEKQIPAFCPLSHPLLAFSESLLNSKAQYETSLQITRVGVLLKRYKLTNGVYPDALSYLSPLSSDALPKDPCSGKSFYYRKEGNGFILYGVGLDLQENRGEPYNRKFPFMPYDIVWKAIR